MADSNSSLEESLFSHYWDDGLIDLFSGLALLAIGVCWTLGWPVFGAVIPALLLPLWGPLHRALVEPRAGFVEFSERRQRRSRRGLGLTVLAGAAALLAVVGGWLSVRAGGVPIDAARASAGLPAVLLAVAAVLGAWLLHARRFYLYALALVLTGTLTVILAWEPSAAFFLGGTLITASGVALMVRFLRSSEAWAEAAR